MKFIADENVEAYLIDILRIKGHEVLSIRETSFGISDLQVLQLAKSFPDHYFITNDRDFGQLLFKEKIKITAGILYLRFNNLTKQKRITIINEFINSQLQVLEGNFVVITEDRIRIKPLL